MYKKFILFLLIASITPAAFGMKERPDRDEYEEITNELNAPTMPAECWLYTFEWVEDIDLVTHVRLTCKDFCKLVKKHFDIKGFITIPLTKKLVINNELTKQFMAEALKKKLIRIENQLNEKKFTIEIESQNQLDEFMGKIKTELKYYEQTAPTKKEKYFLCFCDVGYRVAVVGGFWIVWVGATAIIFIGGAEILDFITKAVARYGGAPDEIVKVAFPCLNRTLLFCGLTLWSAISLKVYCKYVWRYKNNQSPHLKRIFDHAYNWFNRKFRKQKEPFYAPLEKDVEGLFTDKEFEQQLLV